MQAVAISSQTASGFPPGAVRSCENPAFTYASCAGMILSIHDAGVGLADTDELRQALVAQLPRMRRFAWSLTRNHADAEDLLQSSCERAMLNADSAPMGDALLPWTFTMMRNLWISETRKRSVRQGAGQVDAQESSELTTSSGPEDAIRSSQLMAQIRALPEGFSAVLLLVSVEGHSYQEAADILDIPVGTVMSRMSGARQKLKAAMAEVPA